MKNALDVFLHRVGKSNKDLVSMCIFPLEDISVMAEYDTPCCVPLLNNNNLASIHGRVPLWELWDLAPYAEGLGRSLTLLDNGHIDLSPGCAPYSGL